MGNWKMGLDLAGLAKTIHVTSNVNKTECNSDTEGAQKQQE